MCGKYIVTFIFEGSAILHRKIKDMILKAVGGDGDGKTLH